MTHAPRTFHRRILEVQRDCHRPHPWLISFSLGAAVPGIVTMQPSRIFETVLYAEDLAAAERFYHEALGLELIERGNLAARYSCCGGVLLIFDPRKSAAPGRDVPAHGTSGAGHVAFAAKPEELESWREQLRQAGISIE